MRGRECAFTRAAAVRSAPAVNATAQPQFTRRTPTTIHGVVASVAAARKERATQSAATDAPRATPRLGRTTKPRGPRQAAPQSRKGLRRHLESKRQRLHRRAVEQALGRSPRQLAIARRTAAIGSPLPSRVASPPPSQTRHAARKWRVVAPPAPAMRDPSPPRKRAPVPTEQRSRHPPNRRYLHRRAGTSGASTEEERRTTPRRSAAANNAFSRTLSSGRPSTKAPVHHSGRLRERAKQRWTAAKQRVPPSSDERSRHSAEQSARLSNRAVSMASSPARIDAAAASPGASPAASRTACPHISRDGSVTLMMGDVTALSALSAPATLRAPVQPHLHISRNGCATLTVGAKIFAVPLGDCDGGASVVNPLLSALAPPTLLAPRAMLAPTAAPNAPTVAPLRPPNYTKRARSAPVPRRPVPHVEEERRFAVLVAAAAAARRRIARARERAAQLAEQARLEEENDERRLAQARVELIELRRIAEVERVEAEHIAQARAELERLRRLAEAERAAMEIVRAQRAKLDRELLERVAADRSQEASARAAAACTAAVDAAAAAAAAGAAHSYSAAERARDARNYAARQRRRCAVALHAVVSRAAACASSAAAHGTESAVAAWTAAALLGAERRRVRAATVAAPSPRPDAEAPVRMAFEAQPAPASVAPPPSLTIAFAPQPRSEGRVVVNAANWDPLLLEESKTAGEPSKTSESVDDDSLDGDAAPRRAGSGCSVRVPQSSAGEEAATELRIGRVYWSGALG